MTDRNDRRPPDLAFPSAVSDAAAACQLVSAAYRLLVNPRRGACALRRTLFADIVRAVYSRPREASIGSLGVVGKIAVSGSIVYSACRCFPSNVQLARAKIGLAIGVVPVAGRGLLLGRRSSEDPGRTKR